MFLKIYLVQWKTNKEKKKRKKEKNDMQSYATHIICIESYFPPIFYLFLNSIMGF